MDTQSTPSKPTPGPILSYNQQNPHTAFARPPMPKSLLIIGIVLLIYGVVSLFNGLGNVNRVAWLAIVIGGFDILIAVGLLLRLELARKISIILSTILIVLAIGSIILITQARHDLAESSTKSHVAIEKVKQTPGINQENLGKLEAVINDIDTKTIELDKVILRLYLIWGFAILWHGFLIGYLMRPKVKAVFRHLK